MFYQSSIPLTSLTSIWMMTCNLIRLIMRMPDQRERSVIHQNRSRLTAVNNCRMTWKCRWENCLKRLKRLRRKERLNKIIFVQNERKSSRFSRLQCVIKSAMSNFCTSLIARSCLSLDNRAFMRLKSSSMLMKSTTHSFFHFLIFFEKSRYEVRVLKNSKSKSLIYKKSSR